MSMTHGETVMQKPIGDYARYMKMLLPVDIPATYPLKAGLEDVASAADIRKGVVAFRDFLHIFCERLITDGHTVAVTKKTRNPNDYPFLHYVNHLLIDIGYQGKLAVDGGSLLLTQIPSFTDPKNKTPVYRQADVLRFLSFCGLNFSGIDLDADVVTLSQEWPLSVSYPERPVLALGLKALAIAEMELRTERRYSNDDYLLRCDWWLIREGETDTLAVLEDYLHPLPAKIRQFILSLHKRHTDMGMATAISKRDGLHIAYAKTKTGGRVLTQRELYDKRLWEFALSMKHGHCLVVRAKKADKYADMIADFPPLLRDKIKQGYGCDRKRGERCQGGCQGIRIALDEGILGIRREIEMWLDNELA